MIPEPQQWPNTGPDGAARLAAVQTPAGPVAPTSLIEYRSGGHLLIAGDAAAALTAMQACGGELTAWALLTPGSGEQPAPDRCLYGTLAGIEGHLGAFEVAVQGPQGALALAPLLRGTGAAGFDLVLDLHDPPQLGQDVPPAGYYAPGGDPARLQLALAELHELVGEFEKPKYFDYDPGICAHGRNGKSACRRCIDACPTLAIRSAGERIEVDPYLCQGGGTCASACPSGAITYAYPAASEILRRLRHLLQAYTAAGGSHPALLFYDEEHGAPVLAEALPSLPQHLVPFAVEEIGSLGLDVWLAALAFGAGAVHLLAGPGTAPRVIAELKRQLGVCTALLEGLGLAADRVALAPAADAAALVECCAGTRHEALCQAAFETFDEKRNTIFQALDRLAAAGAPVAAEFPLPDGALFGEVQVATAGCTLCLACASACPGGALLGGTDSPELRFIEANCVQCGLCVSTCPEQVISLSPRLVVDAATRRAPRTLHSEPPFHCLDCGKAFATRKIIQTMQQKLQGHWMFSDAAALRRLQLCDECRVKDMFEGDGEHGGARHN